MNISKKKKPASECRGRFKLVVFFKDHRLKQGFAIFSKVGQDVRGVSFVRFKNLVLKGKFAGRVKWAGIYEQGKEVWRWQSSPCTRQLS